jgi:cell division protein FtsB
MSVRNMAISFRSFLNHPAKVTVLCLVFFAITLMMNGLLWRLWGLHRDFERLTVEISSSKTDIEKLNAQLKQAKDPSFIERQARDKLDLVSEKDLVFVFPEQ